jgi:hypothetical protein
MIIMFFRLLRPFDFVHSRPSFLKRLLSPFLARIICASSFFANKFLRAHGSSAEGCTVVPFVAKPLWTTAACLSRRSLLAKAELRFRFMRGRNRNRNTIIRARTACRLIVSAATLALRFDGIRLHNATAWHATRPSMRVKIKDCLCKLRWGEPSSVSRLSAAEWRLCCSCGVLTR